MLSVLPTKSIAHQLGSVEQERGPLSGPASAITAPLELSPARTRGDDFERTKRETPLQQAASPSTRSQVVKIPPRKDIGQNSSVG